MLRHGLGRPAEADRIDGAIDGALADGLRTADLGGEASTREATDAVLARL
jgi:3-isopropylmalate dehydrogenase